MKAVSNTTPLRYLVAINQQHLLGQLFEKVLVPIGVHEELTDLRTPEMVRRAVLSFPSCYEVRTVQESQTTRFPAVMHRGEREAILLAEAVRADILLIDEQMGRSIASSRNIPISGTLGILERADTLQLVSGFPLILKQLKAGGFFIGDPLEQQLLQRHLARQKRA